MSITFEEIKLSGASVELAAKRWRMGDVPVLAMHGWLDNAGTFDRLAPDLQGCDLVALDSPGHGYSGHRPKGTPYHFVDWIPEVFAAADSLGWDKFCLLGHSMGAAIASVAAGTFPDRIRRLALIEGIGPLTNPDEEAPKLMAKAILQKPSQGQNVYATREKAQARIESRGLTSAAALCLLERALAKVEGGWAFTYALEARASSRARLSEGQVRAFLRLISCPTLLVRAEDGMKAPENYYEREREVTDIEVRMRPGKHHLHLDQPEVLADDVREFLLG